MEIPGLGSVVKDDEYGWYYGEPTPIPVLGGQVCRIVVQDYDEDPAQEDFHVAIRNFLALDKSALDAFSSYVFAYYKDHSEDAEPGDDWYVDIASPEQVWDHVQLGHEPMVQRRAHGDKGIYISLECNCAWEPEHGLQIVFKNGLKVNKIGPYDGHLTNSDAYAKEKLEDVIYK
jgi:hypothetical protein